MGTEGGKGSIGSIDGFLRVLSIEFGTGTDQVSGGWVMDLERLAGGGLDPFAIDVADVGLQEGRVLELEAQMCLVGVSLGWGDRATRHTLGTMVEARR